MDKRHVITMVMSVMFSLSSMAAVKAPSPGEVKAITQRVADWQISTFARHHEYRAIASDFRRKFEQHSKDSTVELTDYEKLFLHPWHDLAWQNGALYVGMYEWSTVADDPRPIEWLMKIGRQNQWALLEQRPYHADDHAVGQVYLPLYQTFREPDMIASTIERFDWILAHPKTGTLDWTAKPTDALTRWGWCDALFMAPPVWARLSKITGDPKYLAFMDQEYHATHALLWDQEEHLFWRDSSYFKKREANGKKVFWARGNGWVFGGLALMIPDLPEEWQGRGFYVDLFKKMAAKLVEIQRADGTWSMGLLGGVEGYPIKEASGTSFYTFGLAWGVNHGVLDRATYEPIIFKAWQALTECVTEEGLLGYVQPVGAGPGDSFSDKSEVYGVGAFLAAGSEVYKLVGGEE